MTCGGRRRGTQLDQNEIAEVRSKMPLDRRLANSQITNVLLIK